MSPIRRLARACRPHVYPLVGSGGRRRIWRLRLDERLVISWSPRDAAVLLVAGDLPAPLARQAALLHDQIPHPRCVVVWSDDRDTRALFPVASDVAAVDSPTPVIENVFRALMEGRIGSSPPLLPRENPVSWRGVGPFGQGGEGMMGGRPYGRPLAMTGGELRDGLELDRSRVILGPFLPWIPPGLELEIELQGDVIQRLTPRSPPAPLAPDVPEPFLRAERDEVFVADLEVARARHYLGVTAELLLLHGLDAIAGKVLRLAQRARPRDGWRVRELARRLYRSGALRGATRGVGTLRAASVAHAGPAARAAGRRGDARERDPAYADLLGELPVVATRGDAEARWRQRLAEAAAALDIARRAGARRRAPGPPVEGVRGRAEPGRWTQLLEEAAAGQALDAFATTLVSLDVDPDDFPALGAYGSERVQARTGATSRGERDAGGR